jgi:hypothetical protein
MTEEGPDCCENGNKMSSSIKGVTFLDLIKDHQLLEDYVQCTHNSVDVNKFEQSLIK